MSSYVVMIEDNLQHPANEEESSAVSPPKDSTPSADQKRQIGLWVNEGMGLSDIQKKINDDFGIVMTYMDVRFLVDDLDLDLIDEEEEVETTENNKIKYNLLPKILWMIQMGAYK